MAFLQNSADKAEEIIVGEDEIVVSDGDVKLNEPTDTNTASIIMKPIQNDPELDTDLPDIDPSASGKSKVATAGSDLLEFARKTSMIPEKLKAHMDGALVFSPTQYLQDSTPSCSGLQNAKMGTGDFQNRLLLLSDLPRRIEEQMTRLERENLTLNQQLIEHELSVANETFEATKAEFEQHRARARRILEERKTLIALREFAGGSSDAVLDHRLANSCNEELREELEYQEDRCNDLMERLVKATGDLSYLQRNFLNFHKDDLEEKEKLLEFYRHESNLRVELEMDFREKCKEFGFVVEELAKERRENTDRKSEIRCLRRQLGNREDNAASDEPDAPVAFIAKTVKGKQNTVEALTNERNVLLLQLEKYEKQHHRLLIHLSKLSAEHRHPRADDDIDKPGTSRNAISTLDTLIIRTGVFFKKYPMARALMCLYMVLLQMWVLLVFWEYLLSTLI